MFRKLAFPETSRNSQKLPETSVISPLAGVADLQPTSFSATEKELLIKFLKSVSKHSENFEEGFCYEILFSKLPAFKLQPSVFKFTESS